MNTGRCDTCPIEHGMRKRKSHGLDFDIVHCDFAPGWARILDGTYAIYQSECPGKPQEKQYQMRLW